MRQHLNSLDPDFYLDQHQIAQNMTTFFFSARSQKKFSELKMSGGRNEMLKQII